MNKIFPGGLAEDYAFCNREKEKTRIRHNIDHTIHSLVISPRRYGKTSLILETLRTMDIPFASMQFFNAFRDEIVLKRFIDGMNGLLTHLLSPQKKVIQKIGQLMMHGQLLIKAKGMEVQIGIEPIAKNPMDVIQGLLQDIENILKSKKQQAVIFMDEFQDIIYSDLSSELQSILRDFIQKTKYITFIISGSHRHMLLKLFDDRNKPFYKLFDRIILQRIEESHYAKFLQHHAKLKWKKTLPDNVVGEISHLTECHAYYLNRLCHKLWSIPHLPQLDDVKEKWIELVSEEFGTIASELSALTKNQRLILQSMSRYTILAEPAGIAFLTEVGLGHRSVLLAIDALEKADMVEYMDNGYRVIDPVMKAVLVV